MIFDMLSIIGSISALAVLLISWLFTPFRRKICNTVPNQEFTDLPPLSLVIIVRDNAQALETNLPLWISQEYSSDLQLIVVTEEGDIYADDVLKHLSIDKRIHTTFVPHTSLYMSKNKLAVTLGLKAACHQLVLLVNADCRPASCHCLSLLAQFYNSSNNTIVLPFSKYEEPCRGFYQFLHLYQSLYYMHTAITSQAYACNSNCLLFNKDKFIQGQGFIGNLHLVWGEYDFLINRYSSKKATAVVVDPLAQIIKQSPSRKLWWRNAVEEKETHSHLERNFKFHLLYIMDQIVLYSSYLTFFSIFLYGAIFERWILFGINTILFCLFFFLRISLARKISKLLKINIKLWLLPFYELRIIWHDLMVWIRHKLTDKIEFTSHKL